MIKKKTLTDEYQDYLTRVGKSPQTVKAYSHDLAAFARWFERTNGEDFDPRAVDPRDIQEYRGYLIRMGSKPTTINRCLIALKGFFRWARQEGLTGDNPFEIMEKILVKQQQDTAPRWLDPKEQLALLRAVRRGLEATIEILGKEKANLATHIEAKTLTREQILDLHEFAAQVAKGLEAAEADFHTRRRIIDTLNVQVALMIEEDQKVIYARCSLGDSILPIDQDMK